jgi:hypothetical protein
MHFMETEFMSSKSLQKSKYRRETISEHKQWYKVGHPV